MSRSAASGPHGPQRLPEDERKLVEDHLPLVQHVLSRLPIRIPNTLERDDLYHEGVFGLMYAARTFDHTKGATFKTYAFVSIRGAILDEIRRQDPVPRSRRDRLRLIDRVEAELEDTLGRCPTVEEIAHAAELKPEQVEEAMLKRNGHGTISLDEGSRSDEGGSTRLIDLLARNSGPDPSEESERRELIQRLKGGILALPPRERHVIVLYFAEGLRLREIGELLGITESRVSQIRRRALVRLEEHLEGRKRPQSKRKDAGSSPLEMEASA